MKLYGYKKCGTCRKAENFLNAHKIPFEFIDITLSPPPLKVLSGLPSMASVDIQKLFNTSGEVYKDLKLKDKLKNMNDKEKLSLLSKNGRLIKRPIVLSENKATVGFSEDIYNKVWGGDSQK